MEDHATALEFRRTAGPFATGITVMSAQRPPVTGVTRRGDVAAGVRAWALAEQPGDYRNHYEWSKAAAERLVRERYGDVTIVRPPLVVGRRSDGTVAPHRRLHVPARGRDRSGASGGC
jgi:nucleoside-diphosphate-sugar epimerase